MIFWTITVNKRKYHWTASPIHSLTYHSLSHLFTHSCATLLEQEFRIVRRQFTDSLIHSLTEWIHWAEEDGLAYHLRPWVTKTLLLHLTSADLLPGLPARGNRDSEELLWPALIFPFNHPAHSSSEPFGAEERRASWSEAEENGNANALGRYVYARHSLILETHTTFISLSLCSCFFFLLPRRHQCHSLFQPSAPRRQEQEAALTGAPADSD